MHSTFDFELLTFNYVHAAITNPAVPGATGEPGAYIGNLISTAIGAVIMIAAVIALVYLIMGAFDWITSGGDKQKLESARGKITNGIIGLILVAASWAIMGLVGQFFSFENFPENLSFPTMGQ